METQGTDGRVYGGDCNLIHVEDGMRGAAGRKVASYLSGEMRINAMLNGSRTPTQVQEQSLCPGCYMVVMFNAAVQLAKANGQSLTELGNSMGAAFKALADCSTNACIEEINVVLDKAGDKA